MEKETDQRPLQSKGITCVKLLWGLVFTDCEKFSVVGIENLWIEQ